MLIIPVIDLRGGAAVHAIAGERHRYAPVRREGMRDGDALSLAAFYGARKPAAIYVADLDSIAGSSAQIEIWEAISQAAACPLWIDCGLRDETSLEPYLDFQSRSPQVHQLILASETLTNSEFVTRLASVVGAGSIILSLDRKERVPLTKTAVDERALLLAAANAGIQKVIALDLATVGVGARGRNVRKLAPFVDGVSKLRVVPRWRCAKRTRSSRGGRIWFPRRAVGDSNLERQFVGLSTE